MLPIVEVPETIRQEERKDKAIFSPRRDHRLPLARLRRQSLPARGDGGVPSTPPRPAARRDAALRRPDMPLRMGDGSASRVSAARASGRPGQGGDFLWQYRV